jgi:hypothetical protein
MRWDGCQRQNNEIPAREPDEFGSPLLFWMARLAANTTFFLHEALLPDFALAGSNEVLL